ncbi:MAG: urease accessory protein UreD [Candidatus Manganitrophus sp.]|nr:urease accessory protein UreD [Candidatus Manganitrophus sp.]WDT70018.1 MAG: urease accessory protein UreD [Candidatus Manganitrophus sp.]WDT78337.1 MAG: urease accessory protein UreD [Candidatus Manganitrophus sp.]
MHGILDITFEQAGERTVAREIRQQAPLRVIRPFYPEGEGPAHLYLLNATAGILEGDQLEISLRLEKGTHAVVTTPAATRVHPTPSGEARQRTTLSVGPGATLEYLAEPVLPYAGSAFHQETDIFLEEQATLFYADLLGPGRLGRGESFAYRLYENQLRIVDPEGVLVQERFRLAPSERPLEESGVMEGFSHLGTLYLFCSESARMRLLTAFRSVERVDLFWGATLLSRRGLAVRALAHDTPALHGFFLTSGTFFERRCWGDPSPRSKILTILKRINRHM